MKQIQLKKGLLMALVVLLCGELVPVKASDKPSLWKRFSQKVLRAGASFVPGGRDLLGITGLAEGLEVKVDRIEGKQKEVLSGLHSIARKV